MVIVFFFSDVLIVLLLGKQERYYWFGCGRSACSSSGDSMFLWRITVLSVHRGFRPFPDPQNMVGHSFRLHAFVGGMGFRGRVMCVTHSNVVCKYQKRRWWWLCEQVWLTFDDTLVDWRRILLKLVAVPVTTSLVYDPKMSIRVVKTLSSLHTFKTLVIRGWTARALVHHSYRVLQPKAVKSTLSLRWWSNIVKQSCGENNTQRNS